MLAAPLQSPGRVFFGGDVQFLVVAPQFYHGRERHSVTRLDKGCQSAAEDIGVAYTGSKM